MNRKILLPIFILRFFFYYDLEARREDLSLIPIKEYSQSLECVPLTFEFLQKIAEISKAPIFIETGTDKGDSALRASKYFLNVHTIEINPTAFKQAKKRFEGKSNIIPYLGDSPKVLTELLPKIQGKIAFWLDAHCKKTPLIQELDVIAKSSVKDAFILIDDINGGGDINWSERYWPWPTLNQLRERILTIDKNYHFVICNEVLIAYLGSELFDISPVLNACTISRFSEPIYSLEEILDAESIIAQSDKIEKETIIKLAVNPVFEYYSTNGYYLLWSGLIHLQEGAYAQAVTCFNQAKQKNFKHWRIDWYLAQAHYKLGNNNLAHNHLEEVIKMAPNFKLAGDLLKEILRINLKTLKSVEK